MKSNNSKFFNFENSQKFPLYSTSSYVGWNSLSVIKVVTSKGAVFDNNFIKTNFPDIYDKEKIITLTDGKMTIEFEDKSKPLGKYDSINLFSDKPAYTLVSIENSTFYIISAKKLQSSDSDDLVYFNFKKDIKPIDLWGGKIISRPYEGKKLNIVLFEINPGFAFEDKGHPNEQITWLAQGEMNFYVGDLKKTLKPNDGVDIGPHDIHGGISDNAIGYDVFFPKREEKKYKNNVFVKVMHSIKVYGYTKTLIKIIKYPFKKKRVLH